MILGLKMAEEENLNVLRTFLESEECDHDFQRVIKILRNCGAIKSCVDLARNYVRRGRAATSSLPGDGLQQRAELMLENLLSAQLLE
jgi:geranylgeranyl pyrophosphate synthase